MSDMSPAPGVPQTPTKAYLATALTVVVAFVLLWVSDTDPFTAKEAAADLVAALVSGGVVGVPTYYAKNRARA